MRSQLTIFRCDEWPVDFTMPDVSIILCTRNNAPSLARTLGAILTDRSGEFDIELLVINNGSTDNTSDIVEAARNRSTSTRVSVREIKELRKGKGYAYNAGITACAGEVVLFTDDDVIPKAGWVSGMAQTLLDHSADAVAGGVVFPEALQKHMPGYAREWLAATDKIDLKTPDRLVGANMAIHRRVLAYVPAFDVELGPGALGFHDETLFAHQLLEAGSRIANANTVTVEHHFDQSRLTREGLLHIADRIGRSDAYLNYHWHHLDQTWPLTYRAQLAASDVANKLGYHRRGLEDPSAMQWQIDRVKQRAYLHQYAIEKSRERNYDFHGLRKLRGPGAVITEAASA